MVTKAQQFFKEMMALAEAARQLRVAPDEAFTSLDTHEVSDAWMQDSHTTNAHRKDAMSRWFMARYCHPAQVGCEFQEGKGYVFPDGGPHDAHKVLQDRFKSLADPTLIDNVAEDITDDWGMLWVRTPLALYIAENDAQVGMEADALSVLDNRLGRLQGVAKMKGDDVTQIAARNLVYASIISAFESFLWETILFWVKNDLRTVERLLSRVPAFQNAKVSYRQLLDISDPVEAARALIQAYLQRVVWHQWEDVAELYEKAFSIKMPDMSALKKPLAIRHDIVHRSGQSVNGNHRAVTPKALTELCLDIYVIASRIQTAVGDAVAKSGK